MCPSGATCLQRKNKDRLAWNQDVSEWSNMSTEEEQRHVGLESGCVRVEQHVYRVRTKTSWLGIRMCQSGATCLRLVGLESGCVKMEQHV